MYGYPVGPQKEVMLSNLFFVLRFLTRLFLQNLFLDREIAEKMDPREERTSLIRSELKKLLQQHMRPPIQVVQSTVAPQTTGTPSLPPVGKINTNGALPPLPPPDGTTPASGLQLPPNATANGVAAQRARPLTPIAEGGSVVTHGRSNSVDMPTTNQSPPTSSPLSGEAGPSPSMLGGPISQNPPNGSMELTVPLQNAVAPPYPVPSPAMPVIPLFNKPPETSSTPPASDLVSSGAQFDTGKKVVDQKIPVNIEDRPSSPPSHSIPPTVPLAVVKPLVTQKLPSQELPYVARQAVPTVPTPPVAGPSSIPTKQSVHQIAPSVSLSSSQDDLMNEPGALYYIQQQSESSSSALHGNNSSIAAQKQRAVVPDSEDDDDRSSFNIAAPVPKDPVTKLAYAGIYESSDAINQPQTQPLHPIRRGTPMSFTEPSSSTPTASAAAGPSSSSVVKPLQVGRQSPTRSGLGRKPSGARELNTSRGHRPESFSSPTPTVTEPEPASERESKVIMMGDDAHFDQQQQNQDDVHAALTYLSISETDVAAVAGPSVVMAKQQPMPGQLTMMEPAGGQVVQDTMAGVPVVHVQAPDGGASARDTLPYRSSFAPSNKAAERKAKAQAQIEAQLAAAHKPGRANGKRKSKIAGAWESSEEEEEEEEDDDDADSEGEALNKTKGPYQNLSSSAVSGRSAPMQMQIQPISNDLQSELSPSQLRPSRNLPQIPTARNSGE